MNNLYCNSFLSNQLMLYVIVYRSGVTGGGAIAPPPDFGGIEGVAGQQRRINTYPPVLSSHLFLLGIQNCNLQTKNHT